MLASRRHLLSCGLSALAIAALPPISRADKPSFSDQVAGAFTPSNIAIGLLNGIPGYIAGALLDQALGKPSIADVKKWIQQAVAELESFVSAELRKQLTETVITKMNADLEATKSHIYMYAGLKEKAANRHLLDYCYDATTDLVPLAQSYDQAFFVGTTAMAYRLFAVFALYKADRDPWWIIGNESDLNKFIVLARGTRDRLAAEMDPSRHLTQTCGINISGNSYDCFESKDGVPVGKTFHSHPGVTPTAMQQVSAEAKELSKLFIARKNAFLAKANMSINQTADCFGKMCKKVGHKYSPPPDSP